MLNDLVNVIPSYYRILWLFPLFLFLFSSSSPLFPLTPLLYFSSSSFSSFYYFFLFFASCVLEKFLFCSPLLPSLFSKSYSLSLLFPSLYLRNIFLFPFSLDCLPPSFKPSSFSLSPSFVFSFSPSIYLYSSFSSLVFLFPFFHLPSFVIFLMHLLCFLVCYSPVFPRRAWLIQSGSPHSLFFSPFLCLASLICLPSGWLSLPIFLSRLTKEYKCRQ